MVSRDQFLSPDELARLLEAAARVGGLPRTFVEFATSVGLRVSEIAAVKVGDIDLGRSSIRVTRLKKKEVRQVDLLPLSDSLVDRLRHHLAGLGTLSPDASIWRGQRGPLTANALWRAWRKVLELAGLSFPKYRGGVHVARHTVATMLLKSSPNPSQAIRLVQKQLGHASPETTARIYADVPWDDHAAAVNAAFGQNRR